MVARTRHSDLWPVALAIWRPDPACPALVEGQGERPGVYAALFLLLTPGDITAVLPSELEPMAPMCYFRSTLGCNSRKPQPSALEPLTQHPQGVVRVA